MTQIGITERGDAFLNYGWRHWVYNGQPAILITKNPIGLIEQNKDLFFGDNLKGNVILHATITGLGSTALEPGVPNPDVVLNSLEHFLSDSSFHKERLVIREDPVIPVFAFLNDVYRQNIIKIAKFAVDNNLRYRTSFLDYYPHVRDRFEKIAAKNKIWEELVEKLNEHQPTLHLSLNLRLAFLEVLKEYTGLTDEMIEICGEPEMKCTGCLSKKDLNIFGIELDKDPETGNQRPTCACLGIKRELLENRHPCKHNCAYCYWKD